MFFYPKLWFLLATLLLLENHQSWANAAAAAGPTAEEASVLDLSKLMLITNDVIHDDIEKDTKKIIRVNPLDLPPLKEDPHILDMDSSLYKIQNIKPYNGKRNYINIQRSRPLKEKEPKFIDSTIIRSFPSSKVKHDKFLSPKHQPKKKKLHFLYNQEDVLAGNLLSKKMHVHVAPGAYPVYYMVAKTNGRFGKYPLKSFNSPRAFQKYLEKNKLEKISALQKNAEKA